MVGKHYTSMPYLPTFSCTSILRQGLCKLPRLVLNSVTQAGLELTPILLLHFLGSQETGLCQRAHLRRACSIPLQQCAFPVLGWLLSAAIMTSVTHQEELQRIQCSEALLVLVLTHLYQPISRCSLHPGSLSVVSDSNLIFWFQLCFPLS